MKKKLIGILVCLMFFTMIPAVAGIAFESETEETGLFDRTTLRGVGLFFRFADGGKTIRFMALRMHYRTTYLGGTKSGLLRAQRLEIPNNFNGYIGKFFIWGSFKGSLDI